MNKLPSETEVTGKARVILAEIKETFGMVPNFFRAQAAVDPDWLELNWNREKVIMLSPGGLDRKTREIAKFDQFSDLGVGFRKSIKRFVHHQQLV